MMMHLKVLGRLIYTQFKLATYHPTSYISSWVFFFWFTPDIPVDYKNILLLLVFTFNLPKIWGWVIIPPLLKKSILSI